MRTMCSVKIAPKPGFASSRSRSGAGSRVGTRLSWNCRDEVRELTLRQHYLPTVLCRRVERARVLRPGLAKGRKGFLLSAGAQRRPARSPPPARRPDLTPPTLG